VKLKSIIETDFLILHETPYSITRHLDNKIIIKHKKRNIQSM